MSRMTPVAPDATGRQLSLLFLLCLLLCFGSASAAVSGTLVSMSSGATCFFDVFWVEGCGAGEQLSSSGMSRYLLMKSSWRLSITFWGPESSSSSGVIVVAVAVVVVVVVVVVVGVVVVVVMIVCSSSSSNRKKRWSDRGKNRSRKNIKCSN